ncbi:MAG: MFS transporter [Ilumatobacteraceae bacterium]
MTNQPADDSEPSMPTGRETIADPDIRRFLIANVLIYTGIALQLAILGKEVYDITGRESDLAWLGLAEFAPAPFLVFITGTLADRFDRRKVAALAMAGEVLCVLALAFYSASDPTAVWPFFLIAGAFGAFRSCNAPAIRSMPPMLALERGLPRVIALSSAVSFSSSIIGAGLSGVLYIIDPSAGYGVAAVMILIGLVLITTLKFRRQPKPPDPDERPTLHSAVEGLRFIRRTPILFSIISLDLFAVLFGGAVALLPAIADDRLHVGDVAYGWLRAAPGIGAGIMGLFLAVKPLRRMVGKKLLLAVATFGLGTVVLGFTTNYAVAFVALMVLSGADMVSVFVRSSLVPLVTPDEKRGRVLAVENVFIGASNELGAFESGMAAQNLGLVPAVAGGGFATIGVVLLFSIAFPALRAIDRFEDLDPDHHGLPDPVVGIAIAGLTERVEANPAVD